MLLAAVASYMKIYGTHSGLFNVCFCAPRCNERSSSRRPRSGDTRQTATKISSPDLYEPRRLVPCCAFDLGKVFPLVVTASEELHRSWRVGSNFVCGRELKVRSVYCINMCRTLCAHNASSTGQPRLNFCATHRHSPCNLCPAFISSVLVRPREGCTTTVLPSLRRPLALGVWNHARCCASSCVRVLRCGRVLPSHDLGWANGGNFLGVR